MDNTRKEIFNVRKMAQTLRYTEYKSITSAISEIVDNSIEAGANKIYIFANTTLSSKTGRKEIEDLAILDNGSGMDYDTLFECLVYGESTRGNRKGIGRFGVGLGQASLFSCPRVEVYSWQTSERPSMVYLDVDLMDKGEQKYIYSPIRRDIPDKYNRFINEDFKEKGTLIYWKNVDKSPVKQIQTLFDRINKDISRVYRNFLKDEDFEIVMHDIDYHGRCTRIKPSDPMFLIENDNNLGNPNNLGYMAHYSSPKETLFEPFVLTENQAQKLGFKLDDGVVNVPIPYYDRNHILQYSDVKIRFAVVKEKFYYKASNAMGVNSPGNTPIGKVASKFEGISVVRAGREIDFGRFDFYSSVNTPVNRWWGCEIIFDPILDEVFNVSSNKQHVELKSSKVNKNLSEIEFVLWEELAKYIQPLITAAKSRNSELQKKSKETKKIPTSNNTSGVKPTKATKSENEALPKVSTDLDNKIKELLQESEPVTTIIKDNSRFLTMNEDKIIRFMFENGKYKMKFNADNEYIKEDIIGNTNKSELLELILEVIDDIAVEFNKDVQGSIWFSKFQKKLNTDLIRKVKGKKNGSKN